MFVGEENGITDEKAFLQISVQYIYEREKQ